MNIKINVLILEDSPTQAVQLEYILEKGGYSTAITSDGKEALEYLRENIIGTVPELIISDIAMPVMNGYELCKEVRNKYPVFYKKVNLFAGLEIS